MTFYSTSPQGFAGDGAQWDPNSSRDPMASVGFFNPQSPPPSILPTAASQGHRITQLPMAPQQYYNGISFSGLPASQMPLAATQLPTPFLSPQTGTTSPTYTTAPEDIQEIITPLPLPSQLPMINMTGLSPTKINMSTNIPTMVPGNSNGLVISPTNPPQRKGSFVLPPSVIIRTNNT